MRAEKLETRHQMVTGADLAAHEAVAVHAVQGVQGVQGAVVKALKASTAMAVQKVKPAGKRAILRKTSRCQWLSSN